MIEFESVTKRYPDGTVAVDQVDLRAPSGEITVLVGPSGCGKTTSLRMINRMVEPTSGRILIDGKDTGTTNPAQLRRGIGYVIQHAGLFPHRTVVDNVATVPLLLGWSRKKARAHAAELIQRVGLDAHLGDRYPAQLSGGQQQRVGVARALAADPPVMLMDEPFSAVDPVVRESLQEEFLRLQDELDKTIVFVTHDIDEAIKLGDRVAVFRTGGRLAQFAEPKQLLEHPADEFVAGFVGKDRGYRALSFTPADGISLNDEPTVRLGAPIADARAVAVDGWVLVVDDERRPQGWLDAQNSRQDAVTSDHLNRAGTVASADGSLRGVLDAALSSPTGRGVVADPAGRLLGTVTAGPVLSRLDQPTAGRTTSDGAGPDRPAEPEVANP
ncbi:ABC transporter ATP-binding protein [Actinopolymorpha singaporensis]|uniref:ABC-type quaternary amine transporter n=1 Tax=Actinopolymorpha singaporensis TaxID=117157 RepID=A0A1H1NRW6_9ACTN|nr:ATP-binding cassette domain-containing protein [Actinopolymorpha singaporensis]SDS01697.1 osmoprotectant transport system ATP-binding protein [Actinopolymorpha singaporensis]